MRKSANINNPNLPSTGLLRLSRIIPQFIDISRTQWYHNVKHIPGWPQPIHLGPRTTVYRAEDVHALIESKAA
jgi:predicted DNA-binding transcriptional regulator AlpA